MSLGSFPTLPKDVQPDGSIVTPPSHSPISPPISPPPMSNGSTEGEDCVDGHSRSSPPREDEPLQCPRCLREFPVSKHSDFMRHTEYCLDTWTRWITVCPAARCECSSALNWVFVPPAEWCALYNSHKKKKKISRLNIKLQGIVSWEPERHYCYSVTFRWEPEGCYCCKRSMVIAPFWFSTDHR